MQPKDKKNEENIITNLSVPYSQEEIEYRSELIREMMSSKRQKDAPYYEFDDDDFLTYYEKNAKAANSYLRPKNDPEDTRIVTGTTGEKRISLLSALLQYNFEPDIQAFDSDNMKISELGENMEDLIRKSRELEMYEMKRPLIYEEILNQGTIFVEEVWKEGFELRKKLNKLDWSEKVEINKIKWTELLKKARGKCEANPIASPYVYLGNIKEFLIFEQPNLFTVDKIPYSLAEQIFGKWERWKYVPKKVVKTIEENSFAYNDWTLLETEENMVEVIKYQNKPLNEFMIMLNGVMMLPIKFPLTAISPSGEYTLSKGDIEPISFKFAYSKSVPAKTKVDQAVLDEMIRLFILEMQKSFAPPLANNTGRVLSRKIFLPATITQGINPDNLREISKSSGINNSQIALYELVKKIVDDKSVQPAFVGEQTKGNPTATEILQMKKQSMMKLGLALVGIMNLEWQMTRLRLANILEHWTESIEQKEINGKLVDIYQKFEVSSDIEGNRKGRKIIEFSPEKVKRTPKQIRAEEDIMSTTEPVRKIYMDPIKLKELINNYWRILIVPTEKDSDDLQKTIYSQQLAQAATLFGYQSINWEYAKQRWAVKNKESYDKFFVQTPQQSQMPTNEQNPQTQLGKQMTQGMTQASGQQSETNLNNLVKSS